MMMDMENKNDEIFNLVKNNKFDELFNLIKENNNIDLDIQDKNYNYLINFLVTFNKYDIIEYILKNNRCRIDILDIENKSILYTTIRLNYNNLTNLLLEYDSRNIGIRLIDIQDSNGQTPLHYTCIFNNFSIFKTIYKLNPDITLTDNEGNNIYFMMLKYKRNELFKYLFKMEYDKNLSNINITNIDNINILQQAIIFENDDIINFITEFNLSYEFVNNQDNEYGLTALHQSIILNKSDIFIKLIEKGANINITDYLGNTVLHYIIIEKNFNLLRITKNKDFSKTLYNISNLNGLTPLHILIESNTDDSILEYLEIFIKNTNLNIQNNKGETIIHYLVKTDLWKNENIKRILKEKNINLFIQNKQKETPFELIKDKDFIRIVEISYYNMLRNTNKEKLIEDWEIYCADNDLKNMKKMIKMNNSDNIKAYCLKKINKVILEKKRSLPYIKNNINIEYFNDVDTIENCFYTGSSLDILVGLLYTKKTFNNISLLLDYPLIKNEKLLEYYKKVGIKLHYKLDFTNIEIVWVYQKLIYPTFFKLILLKKINEVNDLLILPLGIELSEGSHANMIIIDPRKKIIERFEPNGKNNPRGLYYNPNLLDSILKNIFSEIVPSFSYISPKEYLPVVGFQLIETLEDETCKKIGDPNGFCAVWCIWWVHQKIKFKNIESKNLAESLIENIKLTNKSFKNLIRNFSKKIVLERDELLKDYNLTIDQWILNLYSDEVLKKIEKRILLEID